MYEATQNFEVFSKIQGQKHLAVDVLFKAYPVSNFYHSQADAIWPDGTLVSAEKIRKTLSLKRIWHMAVLIFEGPPRNVPNIYFDPLL